MVPGTFLEVLMNAKLIELGTQGHSVSEILIKGDEFLLGRGPDCDYSLRDINISRHHCLIRIRPEEITLVDLGSSNGTFVNHSRVISQVALRSGDEISLGDLRFIFELGDSHKDPESTNTDSLATTIRLDPETHKGS